MVTELLGEATWCIIACKYINHNFDCWGVPKSFSFILVLVLAWEREVGGREPFLV